MRDGEDTPDGDVPAGEVPLVDMSEEAPRRSRRSARPGSRARRVAVAGVVAAVAASGAIALATTSDGGGRHTGKPPARVKTVDDGQARLNVLSALRATTASRSFTIHYILTESPAPHPSPPAGDDCVRFNTSSDPRSVSVPGSVDGVPVCGYGGSSIHNVTISGTGTVNLDPLAMVTTASVPGFGEITTRVNTTDVWEQGGGNYGVNAATKAGPGAPLSQFAGLVEGTLGPREGAIAMSSLASPTGYLTLAEQAITSASKVGTGAVAGVPVDVYRVVIDSTKLVDRPDLSAEERKAATEAIALLQREGYDSTTVRLSIDAGGYIRAAHTDVSFADGGAVTADTTFSDFGCAGTVLLPEGPAIVPAASGCASPDRVPSPTTAPATDVPSSPAPPAPPETATTAEPLPPTPAVPPSSPAVCHNSTDPACGAFRYEPPLTNAPAHLQIVSTEPAAPVVGDTVTFTVRLTDPDSFVAKTPDLCGTLSFGDGETGDCISDCAGTGPQYGPWDPPAPEPGDGTFTVKHVYARAGDFVAAFSTTAGTCSPRASNASASTTVHVGAG